MKHKNCGGDIEEDWSDPYIFDDEDAKEFGTKVPRYICQKCKIEIVGDAEIEIVGEQNDNQKKEN